MFPNPLGTKNPETHAETIPQHSHNKDGKPDCIPFSTTINLKCKKRMLYFPMDYGELTIDGIIGTGALSSAIPEKDLWKFRLLSPQSVIQVFLQRNHTGRTQDELLLYPENAVYGILQPSDLLHEKGDITFCPALVTLNDGNISIPVTSFTDHTFKKGHYIANFSVMTSEQIKYVKPVDPTSTWHLLQNDQEQAAHQARNLIKTNKNPHNSEN